VRLAGEECVLNILFLFFHYITKTTKSLCKNIAIPIGLISKHTVVPRFVAKDVHIRQSRSKITTAVRLVRFFGLVAFSRVGFFVAQLFFKTKSIATDDTNWFLDLLSLGVKKQE
jgi:hypothetical protein